ncbi:AAA family ATPase [Streptomyces sp. NPDC000658]|uniref:AAA family ATPase n=1 Tax=Streptomyces sp. NPDC000658 TaxID=3154266 RepID=UPI0033194A45
MPTQDGRLRSERAGRARGSRPGWSSRCTRLKTGRSNREGDAGVQEATGDAVDALHLLLEARMRRRLFTVVDATNVTRSAREPLVAAAKRHNMLPIPVMVATPGSVCIERQGPRPANRTVPEATVIKQCQDVVNSHRTLKAEGFPEIVFSENLHRLLPSSGAPERDPASRAVRTAATASGTWTSYAARSARRSCRCGGGSPARTSLAATASQRSASVSSTSPSPRAPTWTASRSTR